MSRDKRAAPYSVSELLRNILAEGGGITQEAFAEALGVSRYSVNQLLNDRRGVTAEMALRLSKATSTSPEFWLNVQNRLDLHDARERLRSELREVKVVRKPVPEAALFYELPERR